MSVRDISLHFLFTLLLTYIDTHFQLVFNFVEDSTDVSNRIVGMFGLNSI